MPFASRSRFTRRPMAEAGIRVEFYSLHVKGGLKPLLEHPNCLLNDLIRPPQQRRRDREAEGLGGLEVDDQLELQCPHDLRTFHNGNHQRSLSGFRRYWLHSGVPLPPGVGPRRLDFRGCLCGYVNPSSCLKRELPPQIFFRECSRLAGLPQKFLDPYPDKRWGDPREILKQEILAT